MPKKKGTKGKKGKKGKKSGVKSTKSAKSEGPKSTGLLIKPEKRPLYIPLPGENLLHVLTTHRVEEKELHNLTVSVRALEHLTSQEIRDLRLVFDVFDSNADGRLSPEEVRGALRAMGFRVRRPEAHQMVSDYNSAEMLVDFNGFMDFVIDKQGDGWDLHDEIVQGFKYFDLEDTGKISLNNLKHLCRSVDLKLTEQEMKEMIEEADQSGDNLIDVNEFVKVMSLTSLFP